MASRIRRHVLGASVLVGLLGCVAAACGARTGLDYPGYWRECTLREPVVAAPIELNVLLDRSHSMDSETGEGVTKWDAIRDAIGTFLVDPASTGVSVALTFFPRGDGEEVVPCSDQAECTLKDAVCAVARLCFPSAELGPDSSAFCVTDQDCAGAGLPDDTCHPLGICGASYQLCATDDPAACSGDAQACAPYGYCRGGPMCQPGVYAVPDVPLGLLPGAADGLLAVLAAKETGNGTPTLPALQAVIAAASARAQASRSRAVVVLLATDGFPNKCDPAVYEGDLEGAIENLAAVAADGAFAGARTFVVGVVTPEEEAAARENLDVIASAGATKQAWLVTADQTLAQEFRAALEQVKLETATCEQTLPPNEPDDPERDLGNIRVRVIAPGGTPSELRRLSGRLGCDHARDGFYLLEPPGEPARVVLCASNCNAAQGGEIEVRYPCDYQNAGNL